jgi:hypothetical protein
MGLPFLILLNMWDEAKSRGIEIQTQALSRIFGIPVLKTVATRRKGLEKIKESLPIQPPPLLPYCILRSLKTGLHESSLCFPRLLFPSVLWH